MDNRITITRKQTGATWEHVIMDCEMVAVRLYGKSDKAAQAVADALFPKRVAMSTKPETAAKALTIEGLAQEIRRVDGNHDLGAGRLAEALFPFIDRALSAQGEVVVTRAEDGEIVMVSRQDRDGKTIGIIASTTHAGGKAQREAVAWGQFEEGQLVATSFKRNEESGCTVPLYTHPAPARVTVSSEMLEQARRAYSSKCGQGTSKAAMFAALKAALEVNHG